MPAYADMIKEAITTLKERGGSSLPAIKKYLIANHGCDFTKGADKSHLVRLSPAPPALGSCCVVLLHPAGGRDLPRCNVRRVNGRAGPRKFVRMHARICHVVVSSPH